MARYFAVIVRIPTKFPSGLMLMPDDGALDKEEGLSCLFFALKKPLAGPLFPSAGTTLSNRVRRITGYSQDQGPSISDIRVSLFADEMPKVELKKDCQAALKGWT